MLMLVFTPTLSYSQTTLPNPPDPIAGEAELGAVISPMKKGQTAPFTGVLLSPKAVASISVELANIQKTIDLEIKKSIAIEAAKHNFEIQKIQIKSDADRKVLKAKIEAKIEEINILNLRIEKLEKSDSNLILWVGGSFITGVVVSVLTVFAVSQSTK